MSRPTSNQRILARRLGLLAIGSLAAVITLSAYLLATSPYSRDTIIQPPFVTSFKNGQITLTTHYTPHFYSGWIATALGYYRGANAMVWDRLTSPKIPTTNYHSIITNIHALRFDPNKPYLISGDQFDGLYPRNLSIFYQGLLDPHTALNATDWHNRERIALQSLAYSLSSMQQLKRPVTTLMPISPRGVLALNIYSYPSDTVFSNLSLLSQLEDNPETSEAAHKLQAQYQLGLTDSYNDYIKTVADPTTGLVRGDIRLSSARDAAVRQSSFYDNVVLWKTQQLATQLNIIHNSNTELTTLRQSILNHYWDQAQGHFIDDSAPGHQHSYSSDWLIALPLGFLDSSNPSDLNKLISSSSYINQQHLADPLPIRYTTALDHNENLFVKLFVGSYGSTAIWSYWGDLYITLQIDLYQQTGQPNYEQKAQTSILQWQSVIMRDQGYPETLNTQGKMLETPVYESIRRNGWIVDFEQVQYKWAHIQKMP